MYVHLCDLRLDCVTSQTCMFPHDKRVGFALCFYQFIALRPSQYCTVYDVRLTFFCGVIQFDSPETLVFLFSRATNSAAEQSTLVATTQRQHWAASSTHQSQTTPTTVAPQPGDATSAEPRAAVTQLGAVTVAPPRATTVTAFQSATATIRLTTYATHMPTTHVTLMTRVTYVSYVTDMARVSHVWIRDVSM